jgi:NAD(P)H-quinone oxidoreductase subunit 5
VLGLATALFASFAGRVQADVKTALAFASLTQVGIIVAEIGLGFRYIALIHILGHAAVRTLQLLRAPTLLHDYKVLEDAIGGHMHESPSAISRVIPERWKRRWYLFFLERGYLDSILDQVFVRPFVVSFKAFDRWERRFTDFLSGDKLEETEEVQTRSEVVEELKY